MSLPPPLPEKIARRHDLDALRSGAMLLGIALHAAMAYTTFPWVVQDANTHAAYDAFFWAVHGFRMPLFFLLSGFFTAMLWKKRGAWGLVKHRLLRIGLPLLVGCLTIVPVVFMLMGMAAEQGRDMAQADESRSKEIIWAAVATGDEEVVHEFLENGGSVHTLHPEVQCSLISVAAMHGRAEMVVYLIENDADVNQLNSDGSTALHGACLFGRAEVVRFLLSCGADHEIKSKHGQIPAQLLQTDWKTTQWVGDLLRIPLDREEVMAGRERCREVIGGEGVESPSAWAQVYNGLAYFPVFQHLWFLWFLCWLSVMFFLVVWLKKMFPKCERCVQWMASSWCYLWLVPLTAIIYYWQENGALMFGPDTSAGLLPMPSVLVYHAVFFGFGALLFWREKIPVPTRCHWVWQLVLSLCVLFPLGYGLINGRFPDLAARLGETGTAVVSVLIQSTYVWLMCFSLMRMFCAILGRERKWVRYLSDSSYWLYLLHFPALIAFQMVIRSWPLPSFLKFTITCVVVTGGLLLIYELAVRYTWIGTVLNGRKKRRTSA